MSYSIRIASRVHDYHIYILPHRTRETRSRRTENAYFCYAVSGVSNGSLSPGSGSSVGMCSATKSPSPPTNGPKQMYVLNTHTQTHGIPVAKSDLSAIMAGGKQVVSRVSRSNPELARKISILREHAQQTQPENSKPAQSMIPGECRDGLPQTNEGSYYAVLLTQSYTSASSLPSSSMSAVVEGRIPSGWPRNLH